jgi:hypothetical protein
VNFYSTPLFVECFRRAYFPKEKMSLEPHVLDGRMWLLPVTGQGKTVAGWAFIDFFEDVGPKTLSAVRDTAQDALDGHRVRRVNYIPKACMALIPVEEWPEWKRKGDFEPSPLVRWSAFQDWDSYAGFVSQRRSNLLSDSRRRCRNIERDLGTVSFVFHDQRREVFDQCLRWKSQQYVRSGFDDAFSKVTHRRLFEELLFSGLLVVSSLNAGRRLLAAHLGVLWEGRFYWWIPAYDVRSGQYSPGRIMLERLLEESLKRGHAEFDFLVGEEDYKWHYATDTRVIGEVGQLRWRARAKRYLRKTVRGCLTRLFGREEAAGHRG